MTSEKICCVPNCGSRLNIQILHKFPNPDEEPDRFRTWLYAIGGDILGLDNKHIFKNRRVCHLHFASRYHTWSKKLSANAVPTLHMPGFTIRRTPLVDTSNTSGQGTIPSVELSAPSTTPSVIVMPTAPSTSTGFCIKRAPPVNICNTTAPSTIPSVIPTAPSKTTGKGTIKIPEEIKALMQEVKKLRKTKDSYQTRLKKSMKLSSNMTFINTINKFSTMAALFTMLQFREISKPVMGRRFSRKEKIMALTLYKLGPRVYRWLRKLFVLPSSVTLSRMLSKANLRPGINENIFNQLQKRAIKMKDDDKLCTLIFDEMSLTPHFDYNQKKDRIIGFVNNGIETKRKIADHVLVFMIRGIIKNYKQPIYYSFCCGSTSKVDLTIQIKNIIRKLYSIGLTVLATVCDQGASNVSAINYLIEETRIDYLKQNKTFNKNTFEIDGKEIIPLYDVPHLLKGIRNNLITKNLQFKIGNTVKVAKWNHITQLYENNPMYRGLRLIKNLTENHINPKKIPKMKVKYASQLFSQTVGQTMGYLAENKILPAECADTADLILFLDNLFDSLNGSLKNSKIRQGKELLRNVTPKSSHKEIWTEAKVILKSMKFLSPKGNVGTVPSITNWLRTVENMEHLTNKLFYKYNMKSMWCRHLNQDPLENFFGAIRSHGGRNNFPTCATFETAFSSLLINNMSGSYSPGSNCEDDLGILFCSFKEIFFSKKTSIIDKTEIDLNDLFNLEYIELEIKQKDPKIIAPLQYVAGYMLRKGLKKCKQCDIYLKESDPNQIKFLKCREYNKKQSYLTYPHQDFVKCLSEIQDVIHYITKNKSEQPNLVAYMKTVLFATINVNLKCQSHKKEFIDFLFNFSCIFFIRVWCRNTNNLLSGSRKDFDVGDHIQNQALEYFVKKRKNKCL